MLPSFHFVLFTLQFTFFNDYLSLHPRTKELCRLSYWMVEVGVDP